MIYVYIYLRLGLHTKKLKKKKQQHAIELTKMVVKFLRDEISNLRVIVKVFSINFW